MPYALYFNRICSPDLYDFAMGHVTLINGLSVVDVIGLVVLREFAYFKNLALYKQGKVDKSDYLKYRSDVFRLLTIVEHTNAVSLPDSIAPFMQDFDEVLGESSDLAKAYSVHLEDVLSVYRALFSYK